MAPSSLPAPLGHLQSVELADPASLQGLGEELARLAGLNAPSSFDWVTAAKRLSAGWDEMTGEVPGEDWTAALEEFKLRPTKHVGKVAKGRVKVNGFEQVTPVDAKQFPREKLRPGDALRLRLSVKGRYYSLDYCFATSAVADKLDVSGSDQELVVTLRCLGQIKVLTDYPWGNTFEEDSGVEYHPAFLVEEATVLP